MRKRLSGFARGLLAYILIFALLAAGALAVLTCYLDAYERSRPATAVRAYLRDGAQGSLSYAWGYAIAQLDTRVQTEEEGLAFVRGLLSTATYRELLSDTEGQSRFALYDEDGVCFARLTLSQCGEEHWGFTGWEVTEVTTALESYTHSLTLTLPREYRVELDGEELDSRFIAEDRIDYTLLQPCAEYVLPLPQMRRWELGPMLREPEIRVLDARGREVPESEWDEEHFLSNCTAQEREALSDFAKTYLEAYLPYAGDLQRAGLYYWSELSHLIVRGGELEERLIQARKGFGFGNTKSLEVLEYDFRLFSRLADDAWLVDLGYTIETEGLDGVVEEEYQLRLLVREEDGELLTEAMFNY